MTRRKMLRDTGLLAGGAASGILLNGCKDKSDFPDPSRKTQATPLAEKPDSADRSLAEHPVCPVDVLAQKGRADAMVQAGIVFTVAESKRLIAKAVAEMPIVKEAMENGKVIVTKGTTNTYIAEELLGKTIEHGALVFGRVTPAKGEDPLAGAAAIPEVIFVNGKYQPKMMLDEAMQQLEPGNVVIKGANALDYQNKTAAVMIGSPDGGTTGKIKPFVVARKAHLVIPIGLEKQISGDVLSMHLKMREPMESLNPVYSMFLMTGHIVTELEALKLLADVEVFQAAAGGVGGAEGGVWLIVRGSQPAVEKALKLADRIHREPAFGRR